MTKKNYIQQCLERADKATPGPWYNDMGNGEVESKDDKHFKIVVAHRNDLMARIQHCADFELGLPSTEFPVLPDDDMDFIAQARTDVPLLANKLLWAIEILRDNGFDAIADELEAPIGVTND